MKWEDKVEMIRLFNKGEVEQAVELFANEEDWDDQAVVMFVNAFPLTECQFLEPIKERITALTTEDFRTAVRLGYIQDYFDGRENNNENRES